MKIPRFPLAAVFLSLFLSLIATVASFSFYHMDPYVVDVAVVYRGWPLCWIVESWPTWNPPPYATIHSFNFQPPNFLIDVVFWAFIFQLPSAILLLLKETKRHSQVPH